MGKHAERTQSEKFSDLKLNFDRHPFVAIELEEDARDQVRMWYDTNTSEAQMRKLLNAMDIWSEHLHYILDHDPSPLPDTTEPLPEIAPWPVPPEHQRFAP